MVIAYGAMASITFSIVLSALIEDEDAVMELEVLLFVVAATLLCPITLPCILTRKIQMLRGCYEADI